MKKLNYLLLGLGAFALASCSQEDVTAPGSGDGNVAITVSLPADLATRADFGSGTSSKVLQYAVYTVNDDGSYTYAFSGNANFGTSTSTVLNLNLLNKNYQIAFFALSEDAKEEGVYTFTAEEGTNPTIAVDYNKMTSATNNADGYDCFYNFHNVNLTGTNPTTSFNVNLYRPVAQINWGANDIEGSSEITETFGKNGAYIMSQLSVTGLPVNMDIFTGDLGEETFTGTIGGQNYFAIPGVTEDPVVVYDYPVNPNVNKYVAMQYILVGAPSNITSANTEAAIYNFTLNINNSGNTSATTYATDVVVTNAPIKANYQTNIYGTLLSNNTTFDIQVVPNFAGANSTVVPDGAVVYMKDGKVICDTPALPAGVTEKDMDDENIGGVYISASGKPVYFEPNNTGIQNAINEGATELYFAPNTEINLASRLTVLESGLTIHGNGATITGKYWEVGLDTSYPDGSIVNINISNLNNVKVWGGPTGTFIVNLTMTNCTMTANGLTDGDHALTTLATSNPITSTMNMTLENCHVQNSQLGVYSTYPGTIVAKDCVFKNVGLAYNLNNKSNIHSDITIMGNIFNTCGIIDPNNTAYAYAAPVRVIASEAPNTITLLVDNCQFENTQGNYDILLRDHREDKTWYTFDYTIQNCIPANPTVSAN